MLKEAFTYWRRRHVGAVRAIELARQDAAANKKRYPRDIRGAVWNPSWDGYGFHGLRWCESMNDSGMRHIGAVHEILSHCRHTGWFIDDMQSETVCGHVYQLPSRNGCEQYVPVMPDPWNDGAAIVALGDVTDSKEDAARLADNLAERYAEDSREHSQAFSAGRYYAETVKEIRETRARAWSQHSMRRKLGETGECDIIAECLSELESLRQRRDDLRNGEYHCRDLDMTFTESARDSFNSGADECETLRQIVESA